MPWFITEYRPNGVVRETTHSARYGAHLFASGLRQAQRIAKERGLGEVVLGESGKRAPYRPPSELLNKRRITPRQRLEIIHGVTFLSFLAMSGPRAHVRDILGDEGLLHQVVHCLTYGRPNRRELLLPLLRDLERRVPGYRPKRASR